MSTVSKSLLPAVESFLGRDAHGGFVGGQSLLSSSGSTIATCDPGTGSTLAEVTAMTAEEINQAVDVANDAFKKTGWSTMPVNERCALLHRLADAVQKNIATVAQIESLDAGKVESQACLLYTSPSPRDS